MIDGMLVNFISLDEEDYKAWSYATDTVLELMKVDRSFGLSIQKSRDVRVACFKMLTYTYIR